MKSLHMLDHVLIIGGGVVGLTTAWELARRDRKVCIVEAGTFGQGATAAAGGMLGLTAEVHFGEGDLLAFQKKNVEIYEEYVNQLQTASDTDVDYRNQPTLVVARDRDDEEALQRVVDYQTGVGLRAHWLEADEIKERHPSLRNVVRAVACPDDHRLDPAALARALIVACRRRGVKMMEDSAVLRVMSDERGLRGVVLEDGRRIYANQIIVAAGARSATIEGIPELSGPVVRPVRGQIIVVDGGEQPPIDTVIRSPDVYLVPRRDGRIFIGSTMEEKGFSREVTVGAVRTLLEEAWTIVPDLDERPIIELRCGFRPVSLDGRPILGPSQLSGLFLACGHGRHGILLAPMTGRIMARYLCGEQEGDPEFEAFTPRRFATTP